MRTYHSEDITFCISSCTRTSCFRHKNNIRDVNRDHSVADLKGTVYCELPQPPVPQRKKRGRRSKR